MTTTPSTAHHKQTTTNPLTNNTQPKDKNIVILQININVIRNKIKELKTSYTAPNRTSSQYKKKKTHTESENTKNTPLHHTDQGRHNLQKHKHSHTDYHRGQLISDIISNSEHIMLNTTHPPECRTQHYSRPPHQTSQQFLQPLVTIQPHNLAHNTRTKLRSPSHNHNNQHKYKIQTTTKQTHIHEL